MHAFDHAAPPDPNLSPEPDLVQIWVNGFPQALAYLDLPSEGGVERTFKANVALSRPKDNVIVVKLRGLPLDILGDPGLLADCLAPERKSGLHLLVIGVGVSKDDAKKLRDDSVASVDGKLVDGGHEFTTPAFARGHVYDPICGPCDKGDVYGQLREIRRKLRLKEEPSNDVVMIYYQGGRVIEDPEDGPGLPAPARRQPDLPPPRSSTTHSPRSEGAKLPPPRRHPCKRRVAPETRESPLAARRRRVLLRDAASLLAATTAPRGEPGHHASHRLAKAHRHARGRKPRGGHSRGRPPRQAVPRSPILAGTRPPPRKARHRRRPLSVRGPTTADRSPHIRHNHVNRLKSHFNAIDNIPGNRVSPENPNSPARPSLPAVTSSEERTSRKRVGVSQDTSRSFPRIRNFPGQDCLILPGFVWIRRGELLPSQWARLGEEPRPPQRPALRGLVRGSQSIDTDPSPLPWRRQGRA